MGFLAAYLFLIAIALPYLVLSGIKTERDLERAKGELKDEKEKSKYLEEALCKLEGVLKAQARDTEEALGRKERLIDQCIQRKDELISGHQLIIDEFRAAALTDAELIGQYRSRTTSINGRDIDEWCRMAEGMDQLLAHPGCELRWAKFAGEPYATNSEDWEPVRIEIVSDNDFKVHSLTCVGLLGEGGRADFTDPGDWELGGLVEPLTPLPRQAPEVKEKRRKPDRHSRWDIT